MSECHVEPTREQMAIADAPESRLCVIACAGSGKTNTAVDRCLSLQSRGGGKKGRLALLSFSNVAVDTFRARFSARANLQGVRPRSVLIDTFDAFLAMHVVRPHARNLMNASRTPYLVTGLEPFVASKTVAVDKGRCALEKVKVSLEGGRPVFFVVNRDETRTTLPEWQVLPLVNWLASHGGYTHELGRYWAYRVLKERPFVLRALAARYPQIVVDEAQDVGAMLEAILNVLDEAGVHVSLIGDPNQGIYEFAGATGEYLSRYASRADVRNFALTKNFRSVRSVVEVANRLSNRCDVASSCRAQIAGGAYWAPYQKGAEQEAIKAFLREANNVGVLASDVAIVCRSRDRRDKLDGASKKFGRGAVAHFCMAAVMRDVRKNYLAAFELGAAAVLTITEGGPRLNDLLHGRSPSDRLVRRIIWAFVRNKHRGLPAADVSASREWICLLKERVTELLAELERECGVTARENLSHRLSKAALPDASLYVSTTLESPSIRISMVHKVKGESIGAVMYVASENHATAFADGTNSEVGRIGYVALTRATRLFVLAIPNEKVAKLSHRLEAVGLQRAPFDLGAGSC